MDNETFRCPNCCNSAREESLLKSTKTIFLILATFYIPCPCHFRTMSLPVRYTNYQLLHLLVVTKGMNTRNRSRFKSQHAFFFFFFFFKGPFLSLDLLTPQKFSAILMYMNVKFSYCVYHHKKELVPKRGFGPICGFIC